MIEKKYISESELADFIGCTQYKLQKDRYLFGHSKYHLPWVKINGRIFYPIQAVRDWLRENEEKQGVFCSSDKEGE